MSAPMHSKNKVNIDCLWHEVCVSKNKFMSEHSIFKNGCMLRKQGFFCEIILIPYFELFMAFIIINCHPRAYFPVKN